MSSVKARWRPPRSASSGAEFDASGRYRYRLWRVWDVAGPRVTFVMLNPSTADATVDDPTIRRCIAFAHRWGCGGLEVVNLFAYRATRPRDLRRAVNPIGPENDQILRAAARRSQRVIAAWGYHGVWHRRGMAVLRLLAEHRVVECLGTTRNGQPRHPLYVNGNTRPRRIGPFHCFVATLARRRARVLAHATPSRRAGIAPLTVAKVGVQTRRLAIY